MRKQSHPTTRCKWCCRILWNSAHLFFCRTWDVDPIQKSNLYFLVLFCLWDLYMWGEEITAFRWGGQSSKPTPDLQCNIAPLYHFTSLHYTNVQYNPPEFFMTPSISCRIHFVRLTGVSFVDTKSPSEMQKAESSISFLRLSTFFPPYNDTTDFARNAV